MDNNMETPNSPKTDAQHRPSQVIAYLLWPLSLACFVLGISLPMFSLTKLVFLNDEFSLLAGLWQLMTQGDVLLFIVLLLFSVLGPSYKYYLLCRLIWQALPCPQHLKAIQQLMLISKWSMADVFLIAVLVSTVKLGGLANVEAHIGLLFFGLSVVTSLYLSHLMLKPYHLVRKAAP